MAATNPTSIGAITPVTSINTVDLAPATPQPAEARGEALDPNACEAPRGTDPAGENTSSAHDSSDPTSGVGVDGEVAIWEARYSKRNFIGRIGTRIFATLAMVALAYYIWGNGHENMALLGWICLAAVVLFWISLIVRIVQAHYSHYYRLTNRRLFVSTGVIHRRRDMMELLRIKDVFTRQQSLSDRWLGLGTVVVVPTEKELPTFYLAGVDDPKEVMDLIWHHARAERDHRSVKVDSV